MEWNNGMGKWNGTMGWNNGMEEWDGKMGWKNGVEKWDGTMEWNNGMEQWDGRMGWKNGMEGWDGTVIVLPSPSPLLPKVESFLQPQKPANCYTITSSVLIEVYFFTEMHREFVF